VIEDQRLKNRNSPTAVDIQERDPSLKRWEKELVDCRLNVVDELSILI